MMDMLEILENTMSEICIDYCKYSAKSDAGEIAEDEFADICEKCPICRSYTEKRERKAT